MAEHNYSRSNLEEKYTKEVLRILALPEIRKNAFISISEQRAQTMRLGEGNLKQSEWESFKTEIVRLRNTLNCFIQNPTEKELTILIKEKRINKFILFDRKMLDRHCKPQGVVYEEDLQAAKIVASAFRNALKV